MRQINCCKACCKVSNATVIFALSRRQLYDRTLISPFLHRLLYHIAHCRKSNCLWRSFVISSRIASLAMSVPPFCLDFHKPRTCRVAPVFGTQFPPDCADVPLPIPVRLDLIAPAAHPPWTRRHRSTLPRFVKVHCRVSVCPRLLRLVPDYFARAALMDAISAFRASISASFAARADFAADTPLRGLPSLRSSLPHRVKMRSFASFAFLMLV